ncbi:MAG: MotA/TolQ/ExbB proton channel family protein [Elusimicrobiales bacterium]|nr:MotA/TolQ/ExbB proton channel family protein [Elusimicrobiales bacterium]
MRFSLRELLLAGGPILVLLAAASVYSLAVIFERWNFFKKHARKAGDTGHEAARQLKTGRKKAADYCRRCKTLAGDGLARIIEFQGGAEERRAHASAVVERQAGQLQKNLTFLATIGSTAPFIGLFGTVVGVMRAFRDLAAYSGAGPSVVAAGIAEALVNTAAGLFVAIPAVFAYNYFVSKIADFTRDMEWAAEEIIAAAPPDSESAAIASPRAAKQE